MKKMGWLFRLSSKGISLARIEDIAGGIGVGILIVAAGMAAAQVQNPSPSNPLPQPEAPMSVPAGYAAHGSVDVGGRMANITGGGAMYDTLVNLRSGPRVQGETFELHALPGNLHPYFDDLSAFSNGFGGDPDNFSSLTITKGKYYEFDGTFTRDRQYFDYDLLGNPNIPSGQSIPVGTSGASLAWPQVEQSPVMFNTVRRMTTTHLTLLPVSRVTYQFGYAQHVFQGPTLSPGESVGKNNALLAQFERNSTDDFTGEIDWKPIRDTQFTFEEEVNHYKENTSFTMAPSQYIVQEADGQPVALGDWNSYTPYTSSNCNSLGSTSLLSPSTTPGGLPVINPACSVVVSYLRSQPTRILYPSEIFRFQSGSIKNVMMNGDVRYTDANLNLPNYYENFQGFDWVPANARTHAPAYGINSMTFTGKATAKREVLAADYGIVWQASKKVSFSDQFDYSNVQEPGTANITAGQTQIQTSSSAPGYGTINYNGPLAPGAPSTVEGSPNGTPLPDFYGQKLVTNDLTGTWNGWSRGTLSLTYRYRHNVIAEGIPHSAPLPVGATIGGTVTVNQTGGVFHIAMHPTNNWDVDGSVEMLYADNAFTPIEPRQLWQYRMHTMYRPKQWATITAAYNDLERHNNTNANALTGSTYYGPLDHVDYSRAIALGAVLQPPNKPYGFNLNYGYTDVYAATNICYDAGATATQPGSAAAPGSVPASVVSSGNVYPNGVCANITAYGVAGLVDWWARDFEHAPTQYGSAALTLTAGKSLTSNIGYNISSVDGSRFFNDARQVNGSLVSTYQTPFVEVAWTVHPGLTWKAEYNYYGYGEGGPSGPEYCSTSTGSGATPVPCTSLPYQTGRTISPAGETAPRNFHANNVTMGVHYQF